MKHKIRKITSYSSFIASLLIFSLPLAIVSCGIKADDNLDINEVSQINKDSSYCIVP